MTRAAIVQEYSIDSFHPQSTHTMTLPPDLCRCADIPDPDFEIKIDQIPYDGANIATKTDSLLEALNGFQSEQPFKVGDKVSLFCPCLPSNSVGTGHPRIASLRLMSLTVTEVKYSLRLTRTDDQVSIVGWVFKTEEYPTLLFKARFFRKN